MNWRVRRPRKPACSICSRCPVAVGRCQRLCHQLFTPRHERVISRPVAVGRSGIRLRALSAVTGDGHVHAQGGASAVSWAGRSPTSARYRHKAVRHHSTLLSHISCQYE